MAKNADGSTADAERRCNTDSRLPESAMDSPCVPCRRFADLQERQFLLHSLRAQIFLLFYLYFPANQNSKIRSQWPTCDDDEMQQRQTYSFKQCSAGDPAGIMWRTRPASAGLKPTELYAGRKAGATLLSP